ncbi:MAG: site-specific integrase [Sedimenticolaceae bacterium]
MLKKFFKQGDFLERLQSNPLHAYLDTFATALVEDAYASSTVRSKLRWVVEFGWWLQEEQLTAAQLSEHIIDRFLEELRRLGRLKRGQRPTILRFVAYLQSQGIIPLPEPVCDTSPQAELERQYERYLRTERGLTTATVVNYRPVAHGFLVHHFGEGPLRLEELTGSDISTYVLTHARCQGAKRAQLLVTALRSFFRFLLREAKIQVDLAACVPTVADWRLSSVPKFLTEEEVRRLLDGCDRTTATGRRDYAVLVLLARLGLRAGEVVALAIDDIDWRAGEVMIRGKGLVHERLPLLTEPGEALAAYLHRDRPETHSRRVFVRMKAPHSGFAGPSTVSTIVRRALKRAGLQPPTKGAHILRHTLATGMLRGGASMSEIGQVLRHRSPNTTEIYAKVDLSGLRSLAQPWPDIGGGR